MTRGIADQVRALRIRRATKGTRPSIPPDILRRIAASEPTGGAKPSKPDNAPVQASAPAKETTMKKRKAKKPAVAKPKKRGVSESAANLRAAKAKKPTAAKTTIPALEVAAFVCRDGGASMAELEKEFGIDAHPMRAKIHYVRHKLGYGVETREGRYYGTAPKAA